MNGYDRVRRALGFLELYCRGPFLARFVNLAASAGLPLSDVRAARHGIVASIPAGALRRLRPLARATRTRVRVVRRGGVHFLWRRLRRRRLLIAGACVSLAAVYYLSSFVWFIEVRGTEMLPVDAVVEHLAEAGLYPGVPKARLDIPAVRRALLVSDCGLAWAAIDIRGTRAIVQVVEEPSDAAGRVLSEPGDIVASRDGQLTQVLVLAGTPAVRAGATVRRGETLIAGRPGPPGGVGVRARGVCRARVWYECYREAPLSLERVSFTGRAMTQVVIRFNGHEIILNGWKKIPFAAYRIREQARHLALWRNIRVPVEVITREFAECVESWEVRTPARAADEARLAAREWLRGAIPRLARVISESEQVVAAAPGVVGVRVLVETREDIGRFLPYGPSSAEEGPATRG